MFRKLQVSVRNDGHAQSAADAVATEQHNREDAMSDLIGSLETLFVRQGWTAKIERRQQAEPDCQGAKDAAVTDEKSPS